MIIIFIYRLIIKRFQIGVNHQIENDYQNHWRICDTMCLQMKMVFNSLTVFHYSNRLIHEKTDT
jgi:hypothetical protein